MSTAGTVQAKPAAVTRPYAPSWFDVYKQWVERLPFPVWSFYLGFAVLLVALEHGIQWYAGNLAFGLLSPFHIWYVLQSIYLLGGSHYLDRYAGAAFDTYRPALQVDQAHADALRYQLTTLPARPAFLVAFFSVLTSPIWLALTPTTYAPLYLTSSPLVLAVNGVFFLSSWWLGGFAVYHSIHQLRAVSRAYAPLSKINLFQLRPLYALSGVTARTAIGFVLYITAWSIVLPGVMNDPGSLAMAIPLLTLALFTFLSPLMEIHRRLVDEKETVLGESSSRLTDALANFHRSVDRGATDQALQDKNLVAAIEYEYGLINKIPTWPWQPETFRILITALLLPIVLFIIQFILTRILAT